MVHANEHDVALLKEALRKRDGASLCYIIIFYGYPQIRWERAIDGLPREDQDFISKELREYEKTFDYEECSGL